MGLAVVLNRLSHFCAVLTPLLYRLETANRKFYLVKCVYTLSEQKLHFNTVHRRNAVFGLCL